MSGDVQPSEADSMIAYTTLPSTTTISTWPAGSNRRARGARDSGTNSAAHTIATAATGTLIQKTDRQPKASTSPPPRIGPSASASPDIEPKTPMARARSAVPVYVFATIATAAGLSMVPPTACSARAATSQPTPGASPHSSDPRPKTARPTWNTRRRPTRSAVDPASTRNAASTSE